jgi:hypothetical protein
MTGLPALEDPQEQRTVPASPQSPVDPLPSWGSSSAVPEPCAPVRVGPLAHGKPGGPSGAALSPWWTRVRLFTRDRDGLPLVLVGSLGSALGAAHAVTRADDDGWFDAMQHLRAVLSRAAHSHSGSSA